MRIPCPFCGPRDLTEFSYLGDATIERPTAAGEEARQRFVEAVYLRDNVAGAMSEWWYHGAGCRRWLRVTRDTRTHDISAAEFATPSAPP